MRNYETKIENGGKKSTFFIEKVPKNNEKAYYYSINIKCIDFQGKKK